MTQKKVRPHRVKKVFHTTLLIVFFIFLCIASDAQICGNPKTTIYGLSNSGNIAPINVGSASAGATINPAYPTSTTTANGLGYNAANGKFYYFQNGTKGASQLFVSFDPSTNTYTTLAGNQSMGSVFKGCITNDGTGYYCTDDNGALCYYNIAANTWTIICSNFTDQNGNNVNTIFTYGGDIAIDSVGDLWVVVSTTTVYGLYKISAPLPTTAVSVIDAIQIINPNTTNPAGLVVAGIAFNPTGQIYISTVNSLYILNNDLSITLVNAFSSPGIAGDLTSCSFPVTSLPLTWLNVSATLQNNNTAIISWQVAEQIDNKYFTVERSADGINWQDINTTTAAGNYVLTETYNYTDASPLHGNNYYRIAQTDFDGKTSYSVIKILTVSLQSKIAMWPNPAKDILNIQQNMNGVYNINAEIFNQSGQRVLTTLLKSGINSINIFSLPPSFYIVHVELSNGEKYNQKFVKL